MITFERMPELMLFAAVGTVAAGLLSMWLTYVLTARMGGWGAVLGMIGAAALVLGAGYALAGDAGRAMAGLALFWRAAVPVALGALAGALVGAFMGRLER